MTAQSTSAPGQPPRRRWRARTRARTAACQSADPPPSSTAMNATAVVPNAATAKLMTPLARYTSTMPAPSAAYASPCTMPLSSICWLTSQPCSVITTAPPIGRLAQEANSSAPRRRRARRSGRRSGRRPSPRTPRGRRACAATVSDCSTTTIACPASRSARSDVDQPLHHERARGRATARRPAAGAARTAARTRAPPSAARRPTTTPRPARRCAASAGNTS